MKRVLIIIAVLLLLPAMLLAWVTATQSGLRWLYQQTEAYLPGEISLNKLSGRLIGPITLEQIEYRQDGALIKAEQILFDWQPVALLAANIDISRLQIRTLSVVLPEAEKTDPAQIQARMQPITLPDIHLPWRMLLKDAEIDGLSVTQGDQTFSLKKISLNATTFFSKVDIDEFRIDADAFSLNIKGNLRPTRNYRHELEIVWQAELPSSAVITGQGRLAGNMEKTRIKQQLSGPLQLTLDGELKDMLNQLGWQAKVDVSHFDVSQLGTDWPALSGALKLDAQGDLATAALSGTLKGEYPELGRLDANFALQRLGDNTIQLDDLKIHTPLGDTRLDARGQWVPASNGGDIKLDLAWQNLRWPVQGPPWFNSASGTGSIEGNLDRYQIELTSDSPWPQIAPSTWHARAEGNLEGLNIDALRITALDAEAVATAQLDWSPVLSWKAEFSASGIDPASLLPQWPGRLNAKLNSKGHFENSQLIADADITQLSGKLRNYPVSLRSRLKWRDNSLGITRFDLDSGGSKVRLQGQAGETLKLDWAITSGDLAELYPDAKGQLQAQGQISGPRLTPVFKAKLNGKALRMLNYQIGAIDAAIDVDLFRWQHIDIRLAAQSLSMESYALQSLDINGDSRQMQAKAVSKQATAQVELKGEAHAKGWRGRIERAELQSEPFTNWQLIAPTALDISGNSLSVDSLCWRNNREASLCTSVHREDTAWRSHIEIKTFPLMVFDRWLPPDLKLESVADATAELRFQAPEQLQGQVNIEFPPGAVTYPMLGDERDRWEYRHGKIKIVLNPQGLEASSEIAMSNGDRFHGELVLAGLKPLTLIPSEQPLKARVQLTVHDLSLIEAIVPEVYDPRGEMKLNLAASGSLTRPILSGRAQLINASLQIPRLGLSIDQISLNSQSQDTDKLNFQLDARSGDGNLSIQGHTRLDRTAGWPSEINIKGDQFEVSRIPEARVLVSPDLQVKLKNRSIDIQGNVHIPYAKLQPKDITTAARVSNDAVIIGGEQPAEEKWLIHTRIRLTLGERVNFYGYGFEGRFGGSLLLEDEPGQLTRATGELNIPEGNYRAYGQRLEVEHGRIIYTGGPLTNPGLDLRAVRRVNDITAGILVKGSLNQPRLELFSSPAMGQTDTLAYLLLGGPIENASSEEGEMMAKAALAMALSGGDRLARTLGDRFGFDVMRVETGDTGDQASLVVGRYLSPGLYASYGVGLVEAVNTLTLRYQITDNWQVKVESGGYQGADILYTIER